MPFIIGAHVLLPSCVTLVVAPPHSSLPSSRVSFHPTSGTYSAILSVLLEALEMRPVKEVCDSYHYGVLIFFFFFFFQNI